MPICRSARAGGQRDVLIGKRGFIDRKSGVQIVDWRNAPVSQIYYRYEEGDDYDEEIAGRHLEGVVEVRRNLSIQASTLRRIGTPQGTFVRDREGRWHEALGSAAPALQGGQGTAARAPRAAEGQRHRAGAPGERSAHGLGVHGDAIHRADKHLPEIAALIDREQFELITQPESGLVVIQGGAGSGKTTVALHRIAYLAFSDRQRFRAARVLFVVPSEALVRYVDAVLPSLGVAGVPVVTYGGWARSQRARVLPGSGHRYNDNTPDSISRLKKHPALLGLLDAYVERHEREAGVELALALEKTPSADAVLAEWRRSRGKPLVPRLRELLRWVRGAHVAKETRVPAESAIIALGQRADDIVEDWAEALTDRELLRRFLGGEGVAEEEIEALVDWVSGQEAEPEENLDSDGQEIEAADGRELGREREQSGRFDAEDDPILLRLVQLKRGALASKSAKPARYAHVAVDEAQDRSAIEIKVLVETVDKDERGGRSVTIAGDTAQRLVFDNNFSGWEELMSRTGHADIEVRPLKLSYRSTAEVMQLARDILGPELAPPDALVARSGAPVELHQFASVGEAVAFLGDALRALLLREPSASVALIARYPEQADLYHSGLERAEVPSLRRVRRQDFSFASGVDVTDASQVKGLEFDYVIMVDVNAASYPDSLESRHLLHIAATRAAHQLWLIATDSPSPLLPASLLELV